MILYPDFYFNNVKEIEMEFLNDHRIRGLLVDVDNTLIDTDRNMLEGAKEWCDNLKQNGVKVCIISNTNKIKKVQKVAMELDIPYIAFAKKPAKKAFHKAMEMLKLVPNQMAIVGDQVTTDIWGGNRVGMLTILTKPLDKKDILITKVKRPFEKIIINRYMKYMEREQAEIEREQAEMDKGG